MNPQDSSPNNSFDGLRIISLSSYEVTQELSENIILTTLDDLYNWAKLSSLYPLLYGTACCFIEFAALIGSRFDFDRFGLIPREAPASSRLNHLGWHFEHENVSTNNASLRADASPEVCDRDRILYDYGWNV
jgi:hypothetical protein